MIAMKTKLAAAMIAMGLLLAASGALPGQDQKTLTGEIKCAKCILKEARDDCQNAIVTEEQGRKTTYYIVPNDVSKEFDGQFCKKWAKVKATGTVKEVHGKLELTLTKLELVKG